MATQADTSKRLIVAVSDDRLQAWVQVLGMSSPTFAPPTDAEVFAALEQVGIDMNEGVVRRVQELVAAAAQRKANPNAGGPDTFLVAEGTSPVNAEDGRFEWSPEIEQQQQQVSSDADQVDYFARNAIATVEAGTVIGRVTPPEEGKPGVNVLGDERMPRKPKGTPIKLGPGVKAADDDSGNVVAEVAGRVVLKNQKLSVVEVLEIPGDVDFSSGSVDACVDVTVHGTIRSNFHVHTTHSLTVDRVIEAADVRVDGDVVVRGGVFGQDGAGLIVAGGSLTATLLNEVRARVGGDVRFTKEILNSRVHARGQLLGEHGTIIGGRAYAREAVRVRVLGSEANVHTDVAAGLDVNVLRRIRRMDQQIRDGRKTAEQLRQAVQPLMSNLRRLNSAQRERATELICKADELELEVSDLEGRCRTLLEESKPSGTPFVLVGDIIHPGVQIAVNARVTRVQRPLHGPVRIELRKVQNHTEVVAVNQRTGSVTVLHSAEAELDVPPTDEGEEELSGASSNG